MDLLDPLPLIPQTAENLKAVLDTRGVRYNWLTEELGLTRQWLNNIFNGSKRLTPERQQQVEAILSKHFNQPIKL